METKIKSTIKDAEIPFVLPNNWIWYKWKDLIVEFQQGLIRSNNELVDFGVAYLKMNNLDNNGSYNLNNVEYTITSTDELQRYKLYKNDFLINVRNTQELVGKCCVINNINFDIVFNHMLVRVKHVDCISNIYINALFNTPYMRKLLDRCKQGTTTVIALYQRDLFDLPIPVPDKYTQNSIVNIASSISSKIELNNRINAELEAMAKTLYDYWFVHFDFPNAEGKPYKSSGGAMVWSEELKREIPEGWEVGELSDLFQFNPTLSLKKGAISSYINMDALPTEGYMTKSVQKKEFNGGVKFKNGDLIVSRITPCLENGKTGLITLLEGNEVGFGSTEFIVLRGKEMPLSGFASFLARSDLFRKYAIANMLGTSGRKRVEASALAKFLIAIPQNEVLIKFEEFTTPIFQQTTANVKENQQLAHLRDWLLPMLMNGQVVVE